MVPGMFSSKVPIYIDVLFLFFSFIFGSKNNVILQLGTILNNEASVLRVSFRFLAWWVSIFQKFSTNRKIINLHLTSLGTTVITFLFKEWA
jgi:hypothetical protein